MRTAMLFSLLLCVSAAALADPSAPKGQSPQQRDRGLSDANGRYALRASLMPSKRAAMTGDGRFALVADLDPVRAALPANGRYTLDSKLGDAQNLGTCGTVVDEVFSNGFEN